MKKKNRVIYALLFLVLLTLSSFTLSKYLKANTYIFQLDYDGIASSSSSESMESSTSSTEESKLEFKQIYETNWFADGTYDVPLEKAGIYAIQLYGGDGSPLPEGTYWKNNGGVGGYIVAYLEISKPQTAGLQFQLANQGFASGGNIGGAGGEASGNTKQQEQGYNGGGASQVLLNSSVVMVAGGGGGAGNNYDVGNATGGSAGTMYGKTKNEIDFEVTTGEFIGGDGRGPNASGGKGSTLVPGAAEMNSNGVGPEGNYGGGGGAGFPHVGTGGSVYDNYGSVGAGGGGGSSYVNGDVFQVIYPSTSLDRALENFQSTTDRSGMGRIVVTYLGSSKDLSRIEEMNNS